MNYSRHTQGNDSLVVDDAAGISEKVLVDGSAVVGTDPESFVPSVGKEVEAGSVELSLAPVIVLSDVLGTDVVTTSVVVPMDSTRSGCSVAMESTRSV